ncbi:MAG: DUF4097 family beta strand repeat-containing protein [Nannocystaceae bacterium]
MRQQTTTSLGIALLLTAACGPRQETQQFVFDEKVRDVVVDVAEGSVIVRGNGTAGGAVRVETHWRGSAAQRPTFEARILDEMLQVHSYCATRSDDCNTDLQLVVPSGVNLIVHSTLGDVEVGRIHGSIDATVGVGDVCLRSTQGDISVELQRGNVVGYGLTTTDTDIQTGEGSLTLQFDALTERVSAATQVGDVDLAMPTGRYNVYADSAVGDVFVSVDTAIHIVPSVFSRTDRGDVRIHY